MPALPITGPNRSVSTEPKNDSLRYFRDKVVASALPQYERN